MTDMDAGAESPNGAEWLGSLERHDLRRLLGARTLAIAIVSHLRYVAPPSLRGGAVVAELTDDESATTEQFDVELRVDAGVVTGSCSRCAAMFGPCVHVGAVAVDLACSTPMRETLLAGGDVRDYADGAPMKRRALHLELHFDGALATWAAKATETAILEIAASPATGSDLPVGRPYGDKRALSPGAAAVSILVRHRGDRRLLSGREIAELSSAVGRLLPRDRRVLEHARDRGANRKAVLVSGVEASLAIEAMRLHGGVLTTG